MNRAYSILNIKSINDDDRIIEGIASTPTPDRVGDIVDPMGAKFSLPMPLLWQHRSDQPVGNVIWAKATKDGIPFKAQIAKSNEEGTLKNRLDESWQSIKLGLVRAVSIGFKPLKHAFLKDGSGIEFQEWEWLELSAVTIPANAEATITVIRSIDTKLRATAATGQQVNQSSALGKIFSTPAGDSAKRKPVKAQERKPMAKKTIAEQISAFEATRQAKSARMQEIMEGAAEKGETLDQDTSDEYDGLQVDVQKVDEHLVRLAVLQKSNLEQAKEVNGQGSEEAMVTRGAGVVSSVKPNMPPGIGLARMVLAKMIAYKEHRDAVVVARERWPSNPEIELALKTAVAPGDTTTSTWASELVVAQNLSSEFVSFLRPMTLLGRIPGLRNVPFNIQIPTQTAGTSGHWVGEGKAKPLGKLGFGSITLRWAKAAGIVTFSEELAKYSNPAIEGLVRDDLAAGISKFLDEQFLDPSVSEVSNVSPASITNGAGTAASSGVTIDDVIADIKVAFASLQNGLVPLAGCVWIMEPNQAVSLSMMQNPLGQAAFPGINVGGGTLMGLPVYVSENGGSGQITLFRPQEILLADDGGVAIDVSREASLQLTDTPTSGAAELVNLWQNNLIAVRAERYINWKRRRDEAVYYITGADYGGTVSA